MKKMFLTTAALALLATFIAPAHAAISVRATPVNGVVFVIGQGVPRGTPIVWEGITVIRADAFGKFAFFSVLPGDCTGTLTAASSTVVVPVSPCTPVVAGFPAPVAKTGQTTGVLAGDDGNLQKGVATTGPRFTDNNNGTITDNLTGLIWLKDATCLDQRNWTNALAAVGNLASGTCGLNDSSTTGQWRLPNIRELESLVDHGATIPALPASAPFTNFQGSRYWSSTSSAGSPASNALDVNFNVGSVEGSDKSGNYYVIAVRGGS
jgi:hypothetical protein